MPLRKPPPPAEQRWKQAERKGKRTGLLKTVYATNGEKYTGEWAQDCRHGKGTCVSKNGVIYDGDWASGVRHGFGVRSMPREGTNCKEYSGGWINNKKEGYGANFYSSGNRYEGEWYEGERSGWGRMSYTDGSVYEGEWLNDKRNGLGLHILEDGNRYEGNWYNDLKHGDGKFFYLNKGQLYAGTWVEGTPKCGELVDLQRQNADDPTQFPIPELKLADPQQVLAEAKVTIFEGQDPDYD